MVRGSPRRRLARRVAAVLAPAALLVAASSVEARHSPGALYTGTHSGGGAVEINVGADGLNVTRFQFEDLPCQDGTSIYSTTVTFSLAGIPIRDHSFSAPGPGESFAGSFPQAQSAAGSYQRLVESDTSCLTQPVTWTATTTAPTPQCGDGADNDGDSLVDFGVDLGCESGIDTDETDPDTTAPALRLSGKRKQALSRSVAVTVACPREACAARATGRVKVPGGGAARRYTLRAASARLAAGEKVTLRLRLPRNAIPAIKRALASGITVKASLTATAIDGAGNRTSTRRVVEVTR